MVLASNTNWPSGESPGYRETISTDQWKFNTLLCVVMCWSILFQFLISSFLNYAVEGAQHTTPQEACAGHTNGAQASNSGHVPYSSVQVLSGHLGK